MMTFGINLAIIVLLASSQAQDETSNAIYPGDTSNSWHDEYESIKSLMSELETVDYTGGQILVVAHLLKSAMETPGLPEELQTQYKMLKSKLPLCVKTILWGEGVGLLNLYHHKTLVADDDDTSERFVYGASADAHSSPDTGLWKFSTNDGGRTFLIKNVHLNETLFASESKYNYDRRRVSTRPSGHIDDDCYWRISIEGSNTLNILNIKHREYLYTADSGDHTTKGRNFVFHLGAWRLRLRLSLECR